MLVGRTLILVPVLAALCAALAGGLWDARAADGPRSSIEPCSTTRAPSDRTTARRSGVVVVDGAPNPDRPVLRVSPPRCLLRTEAGDTLTSAVVVRNDSTVALLVYISVTALRAAQRDTSFAVPVTSTDDDERLWISPSTRQLRLPPGGIATVPWTAEVPAGATPGIHPHAIVVSTRLARPSSTADRSSQLTLEAALASEVLIDVAGATVAKTVVRTPRIPRLVRHGDRTSASVMLENRGSVLVDARGVFETGAFTGIANERSAVPPQVVLPGGTRSFRTTWNVRPWIGWLHPTMTVDPGTGEEPLTVRYPTVYVLPPWWVVVALIAAIAAPLIRRHLRRRAHRDGGP